MAGVGEDLALPESWLLPCSHFRRGPRSTQLGNPASIPRPLYLEMFQHGPFLGKKQRTRWALKDADTLGQQVLVEVRGEEGFVSEDCVTHGALVDHPGRVEKTVQTSCPIEAQPPPPAPPHAPSPGLTWPAACGS